MKINEIIVVKESMSQSRRNFIKKAAAGLGVAGLGAGIVAALPDAIESKRPHHDRVETVIKYLKSQPQSALIQAHIKALKQYINTSGVPLDRVANFGPRMTYAEILDKYEQEMKHKKSVDENLDANQRRVGQLGPTDRVGPQGAVGKLVGG